MPTLIQLRDALNWKLNQLWDNITGRQYEYYQNHGHYWQGLKTHTLIPSYEDNSGNPTIPDLIDNHPSDQPTTWRDAFPALANVPITGALQMDVYSGPQGDGYVATIYVTHNNIIYTRSQNYGPETERTLNWYAIPTGTY